jgi:CRP-like cAMP-binding protein
MQRVEQLEVTRELTPLSRFRNAYRSDGICFPEAAPNHLERGLRFCRNIPRCASVLTEFHPLHAQAMNTAMQDRSLNLALEAGQLLPTHVCWRVNDGYLRAIAHTKLNELFTLGIWGPGDFVDLQPLSQGSVELRALSTARVQEQQLNPNEASSLCIAQIQQMADLLQIASIRPVDARLMSLLTWLSKRFGRESSNGYMMPLNQMNLTHRQIAEMTGMSRVTVTKGLSQFRQKKYLEIISGEEILTQIGLDWLESLS